MDDELNLFTRDFFQAYLQSNTVIQRHIFVRLPPVLGLPLGTLFRVERPLCRLPEAGVH